MELEEAMTIVVKHVEITGKSWTETVDDIWTSKLKTLSKAAIVSLAKLGLGYLLKRRMNNPGISEANSTIDVKGVVVNFHKAMSENLVSILQVTAFSVSGEAKSLLKFTVSDCQVCIERNQLQKRGLDRKSEFFSLCIRYLGEFACKTVDELPAEIKGRLEAEWKATLNIVARGGKSYEIQPAPLMFKSLQEQQPVGD